MLYVLMLYVIVLNDIFGICYYVTLLSVSTVYCLLRRCCWPSPKNFAALKQFGVCDNKLFDFDFDFSERLSMSIQKTEHQQCIRYLSLDLGLKGGYTKEQW